MHKIFIVPENISGDKIILSAREQVHHLKNVLRLQIDEKINASDRNGNEYNCFANRISAEGIVLQIKEKLSISPPKIFLCVACAIPKNSRFEDTIDKLTQFGVERIIPLKTTRTIVKLDKKKAALRKARWEKVAFAASQQSQRKSLPDIDPIRNIKQVVEESDSFDLKLIPTLLGKRTTLKNTLIERQPKKILVLIGPEGDFTEEEVNLAMQAGFIPVTLGELILRVETAAVAIASYIRLSC